MCEVLPVAHALTGCDFTSTGKFGTKAAAVKANPVHHLRDFGNQRGEILDPGDSQWQS